MEWEFIKRCLDQAFEILTELKSSWERQKTSYLCMPFGRQSLNNLVTVGTDDQRQSETAGAPAGREITHTICGIRKFNWLLKVESQSHEPDKSALFYLSRAQSRLVLSDFLAQVRACNLSVIRSGDVHSVDYVDKNSKHWISAAALEVQMHAGSEIANCPTTYIETIEVTSQLRDPEGVLLPSPLQLTDEVMP